MRSQSKPHKVQNQIHPPLPKKKRVDGRGNDTRRMWLRDGKTTMPFVEGLTPEGCKVLINAINTTLVSLGRNALPNNRFIITR